MVTGMYIKSATPTVKILGGHFVVLNGQINTGEHDLCRFHCYTRYLILRVYLFVQSGPLKRYISPHSVP